MGSLLRLAVVGAGVWAGYRALQAQKLGVPLELAFRELTVPLAELKARQLGQNAADLRARGQAPGPRALG